MEIGVIGLGKMGGQIAEKLNAEDFKVYGFDQDKNISNNEKFSFEVSNNLIDLTNKFKSRKIIWVMVPSGDSTNETIAYLIDLLSDGDVIIDGGNSYYKDSIINSKKCEEKNIEFLDCGTSGGVWGLENGFCLTIGGKKEIYEQIKKLFNSLSTNESPNGLYVGSAGSGHFVKMIHNGIEYGMMQSMAEGIEILHEKKEFNLNLSQITSLWQHGSVVRSWLLDLLNNALLEDSELSNVAPYVEDSGEGRWTIKEGIDLDVPTHAITSSLYSRFYSRRNDSFGFKILASLRNQFGGHSIKKAN